MQASSVIATFFLIFINQLVYADKVVDCTFRKKINLKVFSDKRVTITKGGISCHGTINEANKLSHLNGFRIDLDIFFSKCLINDFKNQYMTYSYYNIESRRTSVVTDLNSKVLVFNQKSQNCKISFINSNLFEKILISKNINTKKNKNNKKRNKLRTRKTK